MQTGNNQSATLFGFDVRESLFAFALFFVLGLIAYVLRDTITVIQAGTLVLLAGLWWLGMRHMHVAVVALLVWLVFESVLLRFIPDQSFLYIRFFPEVMTYSIFVRVIFDRFFLPLIQQDAQHLSSALLGVGAFERFDRLRGRLLLSLAALFFIAVFSMIANGVDPLIGLLGIRQVVRFLFLAIILLYIDIPTPFFAKAVRVLCILFGVQIAIGLIQYATAGALDPYLIPAKTVEYGGRFSYGGVDQFWQLGTRVFATLGRYDRFGAFAGIFTTIVAAVGLSGMFSLRYDFPLAKERYRFYLALTILGGIAVFLSSSRAALLALIIALIWLVGVVWRRRAVLLLSVIGFFSVVIGAFVYAQIIGIDIRYVVDSPDATVFERLVEPLSQSSLQGNYDHYGRTFWLVEVPRVVVASSPIYGVGPGMFGSGTVAQFVNKEVYNRLGLPYGASGDIGIIDNSWFALWGELGTLGLLAMIAFLWTLYQLFGLVPRNTHGTGEQGRFLYNEYVLLSSGAQAAVVYVAVVALFANHFEFRTTMPALLVFGTLLLRAKIQHASGRSVS